MSLGGDTLLPAATLAVEFAAGHRRYATADGFAVHIWPSVIRADRMVMKISRPPAWSAFLHAACLDEALTQAAEVIADQRGVRPATAAA